MVTDLVHLIILSYLRTEPSKKHIKLEYRSKRQKLDGEYKKIWNRLSKKYGISQLFKVLDDADLIRRLKLRGKNVNHVIIFELSNLYKKEVIFAFVAREVIVNPGL